MRIEIATSVSKGRGLYVGKGEDVKAGTVLVQIPSKSVVTAKHILELNEEFSASLRQMHGDLELMDKTIMMLYTIFLKFSGSQESMNSFFAKFAQTLPSTYSTPVFYTTQEMEYLEGTELYVATDAKKKALMREYDQLLPVVLTYCHKWLDSTSFSLENYMWADSAFRSRVMELPLYDEMEYVEALTPTIEMCNHSANPNAYWQVSRSSVQDSSNNEVVVQLIAERDIKEEEEILVSYGDKGNQELLFQYGFVLEDNEHDKVSFLPPLGEPNVDIKLQILQQSQFIPRLFLTRSGFTPESVAIGRICVLTDQDISEIDENFDPLKPISMENEVAAQKLLLDILDEKIETTPLMEERFQNLDLQQLSQNLRNIYIYSKGELQAIRQSPQIVADHYQQIALESSIK